MDGDSLVRRLSVDARPWFDSTASTNEALVIVTAAICSRVECGSLVTHGEHLSCSLNLRGGRSGRKSICDFASFDLPDPSLASEDLSSGDRRALTELLVEEIVIKRHPSETDAGSNRHYLIRAIPYQDPQQEDERLKAHTGPLTARRNRCV